MINRINELADAGKAGELTDMIKDNPDRLLTIQRDIHILAMGIEDMHESINKLHVWMATISDTCELLIKLAKK